MATIEQVCSRCEGPMEQTGTHILPPWCRKCLATEVERLRGALRSARNMVMRDGNISGEYLQVVNAALEADDG